MLAYRELDNHITEEPAAESDDDFKAWKKRDARARAVIGLSLSDAHLEHVRDVPTAKLMWDAILNVFERHSLLNKLAARRNFYTVSMKDNEKVLNFINRVRQLASTLKSMNAQVDDAEVAMAILNGLPEQYSGLIVALDALGDDRSLTTELVKSKLLQEEQRIKSRRGASSLSSGVKSGEAALFNHGRRNDRKFGSSHNRAVPKCEYCHKNGHTAPRCWDRLANLRSKTSAKNHHDSHNAAIVDQAYASVTKLENEEDVVCLMANPKSAPSSAPVNTCDNWIIDSGASAHMTYTRAYFTKYTHIESFDA